MCVLKLARIQTDSVVKKLKDVFPDMHFEIGKSLLYNVGNGHIANPCVNIFSVISVHVVCCTPIELKLFMTMHMTVTVAMSTIGDKILDTALSKVSLFLLKTLPDI